MLKRENLVQILPLLFIFILIGFLVIIPTKEVAADYDTFQYQAVQNIFVPQKISWTDLCPRYIYGAYGANLAETDLIANIRRHEAIQIGIARVNECYFNGTDFINIDDFIYKPPVPDCFCGTDIYTIFNYTISYPVYQNQNIIVDRFWDEMLPMPAAGIAY